MVDAQTAFRERFEWGEDGLRHLASHADVVVVVDVLSFATAVDIAVGRGAIVLPFAERGPAAVEFARQMNALLASDRADDAAGPRYSLSPQSLQAIPSGTRLVLPSPNGARLVAIAAEYAKPVLLGCLRNASATAACCRALGGTVAVIAAGERWSYDARENASLRSAVEDLVGAGAILAALPPRDPSPEAIAAMAAFRAAGDDLGAFLSTCASGRELAERGFAADVRLAAELDASRSVPRLRDGQLAAWTSTGQWSTIERGDTASSGSEPATAP